MFADALDDAASSPTAARRPRRSAAPAAERYSPETDRLHSLYERGRYVQERRLLDARRDAAAAESALARSPAQPRAASSRINALYERGRRQVARAVRASLPPPSWEERHGVASGFRATANSLAPPSPSPAAHGGGGRGARGGGGGGFGGCWLRGRW